MSEYQYYEFQAIDRPLTAQEREYISSLSSRTEATSHQAIFTYHYSDLPARPEQILVKYFDAMLYLANWGTAQLMFRFPESAVDITLLSQYRYMDSIDITHHGDYVVLDMVLREEEGFGWVEGEGYLSKMLELRADMMRGDMRAPYLVWLKVASYEAEYLEDDEDLQEPPVPPNLQKRSLALETLMDFFQIDETLVSVAAEASSSMQKPELDITAALAQLPNEEKDAFLTRAASGHNIQFELLKRLKDLTDTPSLITTQASTRTIREIVKRAETVRKERARQKQLAEQRKRNEYLNRYVDKIPQTWDRIFYLINEKRAQAYDDAIALMVDLRDLAKRDGWEDTFQNKIDAIYKQYSRLSGLHRRMSKNGL